jgi:hypothetical protein
MSDIAPRFNREPPKTLASRKFPLGNRLRRRNRLLWCPQSIAEPLAAVEGRHGGRSRSGTDVSQTPQPDHRPQQHRRTAVPVAPNATTVVRNTAAPQFRRTSSIAPVALDNRTSLIPGKSLESPISRKSEHPSVISDLPANRSIPPLAPNRPNPPGSSFTAKSAGITQIGLCHQIGQISQTADSRLSPAAPLEQGPSSGHNGLHWCWSFPE